MNRRHSAALLPVILVATGCGAGAGTPEPSRPTMPSISSSASAPSTTEAGVEPSATSVAAASSQAVPGQWDEVASFDDAGLELVTDVAVWDGGFLAIGQTMPSDFMSDPDASGIAWTSADGRAWATMQAPFGTTGVNPRGILTTPDGGVTVIGVVGNPGVIEDGPPHAVSWSSADGTSWTEHPVPFGENASLGISVASGPVGHVVTTENELWFSTDGAHWELVFELAGDSRLILPVAGDEGFVVTATGGAGTAPGVYASGDGRNWFDGTPPGVLGSVAPLGGDWLGSLYLMDPSGIAVATSANGLDWSPVLDVNDLTPPDGPKAGLGMESGITEATLVGEGSLVVMTLGWNHCCATPSAAIGVFASTDGITWSPAGIQSGAYVTAMATNGDVAVAAGYVERGGTAVFWVADPWR